MRFTHLANLFTQLETTSSGTRMRELLSAFFKRAPKADVPSIAHLLLGEIAAEHENVLIGMADKMVVKAIAKAGTTDTGKVAEALRALPVSDPNLGAGHWIGQDFFGINQELSFPFGVGLVTNGKLQPTMKVEAAGGK